MIKIFLGLGILWVLFAGYQYVSLDGDPDRWRIVMQFLGMAAINLVVALFLNWMKERRQRAGR